ncbi:MAG: hypothetical protein Q9167_002040 [Letrouitia subvulpina]
MEASTKPYQNASDYTTVELPDHAMAVLQNFTKLGLYYQDLRYLIDVRDQVSWALTSLLYSRQISDSRVSPQRAICSEQGLFSFERGSSEPGFQGVLACVKAICKIRRLDPDLGGIGVFTSAILQLVIAIGGSFALLAATAMQRIRGLGRLKHTAVISVALIEFHKSQCYFMSAVSVASIVLSNTISTYDSPLPFQSFMIVIPLALNGCVPVVSTLQMISRYARLSWHTISLAMVSLLLSTTALAKARSVWGIWSGTTDPDANDPERYRMAILVCGSDAQNLNNLNSNVIDFTIVWLIYSFCVVCLLACVTSHALRHTKFGLYISHSLRTTFDGTLSKTKRIRLILKNLGNATIMILWILCFAYTFFIYDQFRKSNLVSPEWSFGQVVAIAVWVPSIVEFVYMERR